MDHNPLNDLIGKALVHEDLGTALLLQDTRQNVLRSFHLSREMRKYIANLPDMEDLSDLAQNIYSRFLS